MDAEDWKEFFDSMWTRQGKHFIQFLLDTGLAINALNEYGTTILSYAAECGNLEIAEFLLQEGADANTANADGSKPMHIAAKCGHNDIVEFFLNRGISVDSCDNENCTPLHYVAERRRFLPAGRENFQHLVHILVDGHADINAVNRKGCTPLLLAAQNSNKHLTELFIKLGANVECCDEDQWTILHHACEKGWSGIVRLLVERRFDVDLNARTSNGYTPAVIAANHSHEDIVELLIESGSNVGSKGFGEQTLLHFACKGGWMEVVKSLVSKRCDLNAEDSYGRTPLWIAADYADPNLVEYLIKCGVDVNDRDADLTTLLHYTCGLGWLEVVKCLVSKECNLKRKDDWERTPLIRAAFYSNLSVVEYLIECGADVGVCDYGNWTILHYACKEGWFELVKSLAEKTTNVNVQNEDGDTPLHIAIKKRHFKPEIVKHLLNAGADCNMENFKNKTAFTMYFIRTSLFFSNDFFEVITLFLKNGAYFQTDDYDIISNNSFLKESILKNTQLCSVALINKFNNVELRKMYEFPVVSRMLPRIEKLKIKSENIAQDIAEMVKFEIQIKGYCNVLNSHPIVLRRLCVLTLVKHYNS